jgi:hypothetical protein
MRSAQFKLTQVRTGVLLITPVSLDETPGPLDSISTIIRVEGIPDGVRSEEISGLLSKHADLENPPTVLDWSSLLTKEVTILVKEKVAKEENKIVEMYRSFLADEGFCPKVQDNQFVGFKFEGREYYIQVYHNDDQFFRLSSVYLLRANPVSQVKFVNNIKDVLIDLATIYKVVKFGFNLDDEDGFIYINLKIEMFLSPPESFKPVFMRSLRLLAGAIKELYKELKERNEGEEE